MNIHSKVNEFGWAPDTLEIVAQSIGYSILKEYICSEVGHGFTVITVPIKQDDVPSERELSDGTNLLFSYISISNDEKLRPGFYLIRVATSGYRFENGTATVSFVNLQGKIVYTLQATTSGFPNGNMEEMPSFDEFVSPSRPSFGKICGKRKCFTWKREGFFKWRFGCTNKETGAVINC